ncbi:MAG: hypothetical protein R3F20_09900 [Planctomycetota bacterium]
MTDVRPPSHPRLRRGGLALLVLVAVSAACGRAPRAPSTSKSPEPTGRPLAVAADGALWLVDAETLSARRVLDGLEYDRPVTLSPDAGALLYWKHDEVGWDIWRLDLRGSSPPRALTHAETGGCRMPRYSPDGRRIAYLRDLPAGLNVATAEGEDHRALTKDGFRDAPPSWSADGRYIAFTHDPGERVPLGTAIVPSERGGVFERYELASGFRSVVEASFAPRGLMIAASVHEGGAASSRIRVFSSFRDFTGVRASHRPDSDEGDETDPRWSRDGARLAWLRREKGGSFVCRAYVPAVGSPFRAAESVELPPGADPIDWSLDETGERAAVVLRRGEERFLVLVDLATGRTRRQPDLRPIACFWNP